MISFEWDSYKNSQNIKKHGVSFEEAIGAFKDEEAILYTDPDHSSEEERYILLGLDRKTRLLVVVHCYRESDRIIRLISARIATRKEETNYLNRDGRW